MFNVSEHNFIRSCQRGEALPDDIDDFIDDWHEHDYAMELHEFLGMSWEEYRRWVANPNTLPQIIEVHYNKGCNLGYLENGPKSISTINLYGTSA